MVRVETREHILHSYAEVLLLELELGEGAMMFCKRTTDGAASASSGLIIYNYSRWLLLKGCGVSWTTMERTVAPVLFRPVSHEINSRRRFVTLLAA